jgi:valacyclovir hydrolase
MPTIQLSTGATLDYVDTGGEDKPVAVVLHGLLGTARKDLDNVIDWLKPDYRVIGPSLRGYGGSTPKPRLFPPDFYQQDARDVLAFMAALGIDKAHLLGYSDGGEVSLLAAGTNSARFHSVTVWGAVGYYGPAMRPVVQRMFPGDWITQEERDLHGIDNVDSFVLGWIQSVRKIIDAGGDLSLSLAPQIIAPLLMLLGTQDTLNPASYGQRYVDRAPQGRLEMVECGHAIHDQSWEDFKALVGPFLASNTP